MKNIFNVGSVALTATVATGAGLRMIDLFGRAPLPEQAAIELRLVTNGTAPGATKNITAHYALSNTPNLTVAQLGDADSEQTWELPNNANVERIYTLPIVYVGQRYLYIWFDHDALTGGAALTVSPKINT